MTLRRQAARAALQCWICLLPISSMALADPAPPEQALAFVQEHHLGESLGWLGFQVASRTVTFATLVDTMGRTQAQTLVQGELQRLQPDYQAEWDRNLAAAYAQSFSADELQTLNAGESQPALANKFRAKQRDVGTDMKNRSSELLNLYVSSALKSASDKAGTPGGEQR